LILRHLLLTLNLNFIGGNGKGEVLPFLFPVLMLQPETKARILEIIHECEPEAFVVELDLHRSKRHQLRILLDTDKGITLLKCAEISRKVSRMLDASDEIKSAYDLEVSSPGLSKPLQVYRQYVKNIGRKVVVVLFSGEKKEGVLLRASETGIAIGEGGGKNERAESSGITESEFLFSDIKETKILVSFK